MSTDFCTQNREFIIVSRHYVIPIISTFALLCMIPIVCWYIKGYTKKQLKVPSKLFYGGIIFFIISFLASIAFIIGSLAKCQNHMIDELASIIESMLYVFQILLLIGILYYRCSLIFKDTPFSLHKRTTISFWTFYILTTFILFSASFSFQFGPGEIAVIIIALAGVLALGLIIWANIIFISKVYTIFKYSNDQTEDLTKVVTKTSFLAFISTFITFMTFVVGGIDPVLNNIYWNLFTVWMIMFDVYSNFFCIVLSYDYFDEYYHKLCGKCDTKLRRSCQGCFKQVVDTKNLELEVKLSNDRNKGTIAVKIHSVESKSKTDLI